MWPLRDSVLKIESRSGTADVEAIVEPNRMAEADRRLANKIDDLKGLRWASHWTRAAAAAHLRAMLLDVSYCGKACGCYSGIDSRLRRPGQRGRTRAAGQKHGLDKSESRALWERIGNSLESWWLSIQVDGAPGPATHTFVPVLAVSLNALSHDLSSRFSLQPHNCITLCCRPPPARSNIPMEWN